VRDGEKIVRGEKGNREEGEKDKKTQYGPVRRLHAVV
jgi:hypothetical protein